MSSMSPFAIVNRGYFWPTRYSKPVTLARVKIAVAVYKQNRRVARASEVLGTEFLRTKRILEHFEPGIFEKYPIRPQGKPACLRTVLSKSELEVAKKMIGYLSIGDIAHKFGIWQARLEYILWKAGIYRPGESGRGGPPLKRDAPDTWTKKWQREYILTEMKRKNEVFEENIDYFFPKKEVYTSPDEEGVEEMLEEYGF